MCVQRRETPNCMFICVYKEETHLNKYTIKELYATPLLIQQVRYCLMGI